MKYEIKGDISEEYINKELEKFNEELTKAGENLSIEQTFEVNLVQKEKIKFRSHVINLEEKAKKRHDVKLNDYNKIKNTFGDGFYVREINVPAGELVITKIHKQNHPFFLLKGKCSVLTENGVKHIEAPYYALTDIGTKRIIYCHTDVLWVCVHMSKSTNVKDIEKDIIAKDFNDPAITKADVKILTKMIKDKNVK